MKSLFINKPLSNIDLYNWVKKLNIKHFRGVYSRDNLPEMIKEPECGIINLDTQLGPGTHWVCYRNIEKGTESPFDPQGSKGSEAPFTEYFDSFGLPMAEEISAYLRTGNKKIYYSSDEIQERNSVLCGYWCLYYLRERQKGTSMLDAIHNPKFDPVDHSVNHKFLINYFKRMKHSKV